MTDFTVWPYCNIYIYIEDPKDFTKLKLLFLFIDTGPNNM